MKILQVIGGGEKGGSRNYLLTLTEELRARGFDVEIACFLEDVVADSARKKSIPVTVFPMKSLFDIKVIAQLKKYILERGFDVVHTHGVRANFVGRLAARKINIPVVTTVHSSIYHDYSHPLKKLFYHRIEKLTRPFTDHFIAVAGSLKQELEQDGIPPERIDVVYNGLSPSFAFEAPTSSLRAELGIDEKLPILMTIGRLEAVKNQALLLQIWATLYKQLDFCGVIVGDGPLRQELEEQARTLGIADRVHFLGFRNDIYSLLTQADVFILTSNMEGLPITLLESMAGRTPVVVSKVGGMPEVIDMAKNGYTVPAGDVEQFAARIQEIIRQPELKERLGEQGYETLMKHFTGETFIQNTIQIYNKVTQFSEDSSSGKGGKS
ncbi:glycosyltransferase family 4 protein [Caldalkalibacillus mannanilyticus]|uniref:glycosyltransferase family 4 protein n=1 Tax=Caldalkalibacillus mannanilyticus TaxID=1418 RepID=UPI0004684481|nr:glycosyltransferase family 4 protein [Caldalkalibacillus mannanilyticus]